MASWNDPPVVYMDYRAFPGFVLTWCRTDNHIVGPIKLDHTIAGIYMYAHSPTQESANRCELTTSVGRLCLLQGLSWTS